MNRGDRREEIFRDDVDRKRFLEALEGVCQKTGWQVHAYCLMSNHFHLVALRHRSHLPRWMDGLGEREKGRKGSVLTIDTIE